MYKVKKNAMNKNKKKKTVGIIYKNKNIRADFIYTHLMVSPVFGLKIPNVIIIFAIRTLPGKQNHRVATHGYIVRTQDRVEPPTKS